MNAEEYEKQRHGASRFRIVMGFDLKNILVSVADYDDEVNYIVEFDSLGRALHIIGADGGEPEDQTLTRDWSWVCDALNKVAEEK